MNAKHWQMCNRHKVAYVNECPACALERQFQERKAENDAMKLRTKPATHTRRVMELRRTE